MPAGDEDVPLRENAFAEAKKRSITPSMLDYAITAVTAITDEPRIEAPRLRGQPRNETDR